MTYSPDQLEAYRQFLELYRVDIFSHIREENFFYRWRNFPVLALFTAKKLGLPEYKALEMLDLRFRGFYGQKMLETLSKKIFSYEGRFSNLNSEEGEVFREFYLSLCELVIRHEKSEMDLFWGISHLENDYTALDTQDFETLVSL